TVSLLGTAALDIEINTSNLTSDLLNITGDLTLDLANTAQLSLLDLGGDVTLNDGDLFTIATYVGTWNGGTFAGLPDDSVFTFGSNDYRISYNGVNNLSKEVTLEAEVVPEPATALWGALRLAAAGIRRRRTR